MGTRGVYGFYKNGITKVTYNQFDSYPTGLGEDVRQFLAETSNLKEIFSKIILVNQDDKPTAEQIAENRYWYDGAVSTQSIEDWYCLLRKAQGQLQEFNNGLRYMIDSQDFLLDSLFCEYAYIINLDDNTVEIYVGFQKARDMMSRYQLEQSSDDGYWHCKLFRAISIDEYINLDMNELENQIGHDCPSI